MLLLTALSAALLCSVQACAEERRIPDEIMGTQESDALEALSLEAGFSARGMIGQLIAGEARFDISTLREWGRQFLAQAKAELTGVLFGICVPVLASLLIRTVIHDQSDLAGGAGLLCRLACARVLLIAFASAREATGALLEKAGEAVRAVAPVLASVSCATGSVSGMLSPAAQLYAAAVEKALGGAGVSLCGVAAAVAAAGNLSAHIRLNRFFAFLKSVIGWMIGLLIAAFVCFLTAQGYLAAAQDTVARRSARYVVGNAVPIIGGELSGAVDSIVGSAGLIRGAVGVTGGFLLICACANPLLKAASTVLSMKLAAAIIEPAAERGVSAMASQFSDAAEMLLSLCAAGVVLAMLTLGTMLAAGANMIAAGA